jgi:hypothetical protein
MRAIGLGSRCLVHYLTDNHFSGLDLTSHQTEQQGPSVYSCAHAQGPVDVVAQN